MRVPLQESVWKDSSDCGEITITTSWTNGALRWKIDDSQLAPVERAIYIYNFGNRKNKFYENGLIYNEDGSVADNALLSKSYSFYDFSHAPLNRLLEHPVPSFQYNRYQKHNYLYGIPVGNNRNLCRLVEVRDRLNVPDWIAVLVSIGLVNEDSVRSLLVDVPDSFESYPVDWILHLLGVSAGGINSFCTLNNYDARLPGYNSKVDNFADFCKIIELEKQQISSDLKIGSV